jgi:hypothetical protein
MGTTKHITVLSALEKRALRYRRNGKYQVDKDDILYENALDETGTVETAALTDSDADSLGTETTTISEQLEGMGIRGITDDLLRVYGVAPGKKGDGVTRLIYENANGFSSIISDNEKLEKAKEIIDELEADLVAYSEHKLNCRHKDDSNGFSQMFKGGKAEIRSIAAHNVHENISRVQEGGTSMLLYGPLVEQYDFEHSGRDDSGLGRWVVLVF